MSKKHEVIENNPWKWIPSLYFSEGLPYIAIMVVSGIMYKTLGVSNREFAFYTAWLYLPWVIKPFWSPVVEMYKTKRYWIVSTQFAMGVCFAMVAFLLPTHFFFQSTMALFWLLAFSSATHDIAADGFYIINLSAHEQSWFVGIRSTFYRFAMIAGQGFVVMLAGYIENSTGLDSVMIDVHANEQTTEFVDKGFIPVRQCLEPLPGDMRIVSLSGSQLNMNLGSIETAGFSSIVDSARRANGLTVATQQNEDKETDNIVTSVESFLRKHLGPTRSTDVVQNPGSVGYLFFQLSKPPELDEKIILNLSRDSGSQNISLIAGGSKIFDQTNWNKPLVVVFQVDPREMNKSSAVFELRSGDSVFAWSVSFSLIGLFFILASLYHYLILPTSPVEDHSTTGFTESFISFFQKKGVGVAIVFLLLYRLGESQLVKLAQPFMLDSHDVGGLGFSTAEVGFVYGTVGALMLVAGGLVGGLIAATYGLKRIVLPMAIAMNLPNVVYMYLAYTQPDSFLIVSACVAFEQFGYGVGFTAFMLFMVSFAEDSGSHTTSHFAIMTGFMAMGMMLPMMISGWIQDVIGYQHFFVWVIIATIPGFFIIRFLPINPTFGLKLNRK